MTVDIPQPITRAPTQADIGQHVTVEGSRGDLYAGIMKAIGPNDLVILDLRQIEDEHGWQSVKPQLLQIHDASIVECRPCQPEDAK